MAGTGKPTVSQTVAQTSDKGILGASVFLKRSERDRGNASRLFTTISSQLATKVPGLAMDICNATDGNPMIVGRTLREQFEQLILKPLENLKPSATRTVVFVIDALSMNASRRLDSVASFLAILMPEALWNTLPRL